MGVIDVFILSMQPVMVEGIRKFLCEENELKVYALTECAFEISERIKTVEEFIILLDDELTEHIKFFEFVNFLRNDLSVEKIIVYTIKDKIEYLNGLLSLGIRGILHKESQKNEFLVAIRALKEGGLYIDSYLLGILTNDSNKTRNNERQLKILSKREKEILALIAKGFKNKDIAQKLFRFSRTIETHKRNIMKKLNMLTTVELTCFAVTIISMF